jgi:hypothetical protein
MRAAEFIVEQQISLAAQRSIPDMSSVGVPGLPMGPTNYYHKYRLGVMMAVSPEFENDYPQDGKFVDDMVMVAYSKADADIINRANAKMGYKQKSVTSKGSRELTDTYTISPVANWNKK